MSIKVSLVQPYDNDGQWLMDWWISYSSASDGPCTKKIPPWNTSALGLKCVILLIVSEGSLASLTGRH
ncbi:predicted protein [Plenodomus lingam JN3]|uniref:Predicted protein n=1 Tax=Leptosphaeria maculans (strain JN3 / isolate v23.1.3 / race Av1-4-5-6-7-8) TaxID=985895 RepID=E4ZMP7_LEPMJ|nr:predicted protein [Plenodomus lingam JN3]CBX92916.1 predicted protein [Plenodomus lingam JN3]